MESLLDFKLTCIYHQKMNKQPIIPLLAPSTRFADTRTWTIDVNEYGDKFYELYHVVRTTPKSILVQCAMLFGGSLHVEGNALLDSICTARSNGIDSVGNNSTVPVRFMIKHDSERGAFFRVGLGTAARRVYLNRVTFLTMPNDNSTGRGGFKRKRDSEAGAPNIHAEASDADAPADDANATHLRHARFQGASVVVNEHGLIVSDPRPW